MFPIGRNAVRNLNQESLITENIMKTFQSLQALALAAATVISLAAAESASAAKPVNTTFFGGKAIEGYDAVAYHTQKKAVKGSKTHSYKWKGANWYFSSAAHLDLFKQDPNKYAPQYGGYCAWAAAKNKLADTDPEVWDIYNGKLYLNYNTKTRNEWRLDKAGMVKRGDANYPNLVK